MNRKRVNKIIVVALIVSAMLSGCSGAKKNESRSDSATKSTEQMDFGAEAVTEGKFTNDATTDLEAPEMSAGEGAEKGENTVKNDNQKLIRRFYIDLETKEFDALLTMVQKKVDSLEGYMESSQIHGNSYYDSSVRGASMVIRIPKQNLDEFVNTVTASSLGNLSNKEENSEDVTLAYVDVESHQKALGIEQERLLMLLEKAEKIADIIELENRLSQVRYELESYSSQLRTFDNLIDYSTVTLNIDEVERITVVKEESVGEKMVNGLSDSLYDIKIGSQNFAISVVTNLPYLIIWAIIIVFGIILGRKFYKKQKGKIILNKEEKKEDK